MFGIRVMKVVKQLDLWTTYPDEWRIMRPHFDACVVRHLAHFRAQGKESSWWWATNKHWASLILPLAHTTSAFEGEAEWAAVSAHVLAAYDSSMVGKVIFEKSVRQIEIEKVQLVVSKHMDDFMKVKHVTEQELKVVTRAFETAMKATQVNPTKSYSKPQEVDVKYHGGPTIVAVTSPMEHFTLSAHAYLRSVAVAKKLLDPMWCEEGLVTMKNYDVRVDPILFQGSHNFRVALHDELSPTEATAASIEATIKTRGRFFETVDSKCKIECAFWLQSVGENARERMQVEILKCMPAPNNSLRITESHKYLEVVRNGRLYTFAGTATQSMFDMIFSVVAKIKQGSDPSIEQLGDGLFMKKIKLSCERFLTFEKPAASGALAVTIFGGAAAKQIWASIKDQTPIDLTVASKLMSFTWLLLPEEKRLFNSKVNPAIAARTTIVPPKKRARKASSLDSKTMVENLFAKRPIVS
jgi:phosphoribosylanthranilate isomerase